MFGASQLFYQRGAGEERVYVNVNIRNNEDNFQALEYLETRKTPFIDGDTHKYDMAVERFSLDTNTIPLWIPHIQLDTTLNPTANPNMTRYYVSIRATTTGNIIFQQPIIWSPQNTGVDVPNNLTPQSTSLYNPPTITPYYYMNTLEHFTKLFNNLLNTALSAPYSLTSIPTLTFDAETGKFSLWAGADWDANSVGQKYELIFNEALYSLLLSFPNEIVDLGDPLLHARIPFKNLNDNIYIQDGSGTYQPQPFRYTSAGTYLYKMTQERGSQVPFQVFRGVAFTTSMPIYYENTGETTPYGVSSNGVVNSTDATSSIMCDQDCAINDNSAINQAILQYQPNFIHYITMGHAKSLDTIQFRVFWKDTYGNLNPVFLRHGSLSLKLIFHKVR